MKSAEKKNTIPKMAEELHNQSDLLECMLTIRKNRGTNLADPEGEKEVAKQQLAETIAKAKTKDERVSFYAIKDDKGKMIATAKLNIYKKAGEQRGHLGRLTVNKEHRGEGLAGILEEKRLKDALASGCTTVDGDIDVLNPPALVTKLKGGFVITDCDLELDEDGERCFKVVKTLTKPANYDREHGPLGELREIELNKLKKIQNFLNSGWVGIDVKNIKGNEDMDPHQWILILEKIKNSV